MQNKYNKWIGGLLVTSAAGLLIPYTILSVIFNYPAILREDTATILTEFHNGGTPLILTWFAFALTGIPLIPAYRLIGQQLESRAPLMRMATTIGTIGLIVQLIGLLRWTFVVPVLADTFINAPDWGTKSAVIVAFKTIHQFAGVILGEHLGQLFTIAWTVMVTYSFAKLQLFPKWISLLGYSGAVIYLMAQAELLATVIPGFPVWEMAGFIGSTLWLVWLIAIGVQFLRLKSVSF